MDKAAKPVAAAATTANNGLNKRAFDELLLRKMYIVPSFEIHSGPAGFFDYGPPACALKANLLARWRQHFVVEESMLEMECTNLTPSNVLETSGHVERFTDFMVRDEVTKECFRADKLLEDAIDALLEANPAMPKEQVEQHRIVQRQADAFSCDELHDKLQEYGVKSPSTMPREKGSPPHELTRPFPFNLMFQTTIGPEGTSVGYLRPETAQGLFVNFKRLLDYNQQKMPFAAAQIGTGFRNEISPRGGLLRVREFCMAEIEHFVHPDEKAKHVRFVNVKDKTLTLFTAAAQLTPGGEAVPMTIGEAVAAGLVANESIGYFMSRTQLFLEDVGVDPARMRFRQHMSTEMAHYACDCWDMEIHLSSGWTECVGHADRQCYDLSVHAKKTGHNLHAAKRLAEPVLVDKVVCEPNKKKIGPLFKATQKKVITALEELDGDDLVAFKASIEANGKATLPSMGIEIGAELVSFKTEKRTICEEKYMPSVIEPSFGIGRVITAVMEHSFKQRDTEDQRCVMSLPPLVAPIKVGLFRLTNNNPAFDTIVEDLRMMLAGKEVVCKVDSSSGSVGRRYARADELGIPFGVTVDFQTPLDNAVTVRDRDTCGQIRVPIAQVTEVLVNMINAPLPLAATRTPTSGGPVWAKYGAMPTALNWAHYSSRYPFTAGGKDEDDEDDGKGKGKGTSSVAAAASPVAVSATTIEQTLRASFTRPAAPSNT